MKRLILDFQKHEDGEYQYSLYHPLQDRGNGYQWFASNPTTSIVDISNAIFEYLPKVPKLEDKDKGIFQDQEGWYYMHQSKIQAYEFTIQALTEERNKLVSLLSDMSSSAKSDTRPNQNEE